MAAAFDRVCDAVRACMKETQTPGVAVGLLHDGEEHVAGFGVTSTENPLDVTPRHAVPDRLDHEDVHRDRGDAAR